MNSINSIQNTLQDIYNETSLSLKKIENNTRQKYVELLEEKKQKPSQAVSQDEKKWLLLDIFV